jgi:hypothetical protein
MNSTQHAKVVTELCELIGSTDPQAAIKGGRLRIGERFVTLIYDEMYNKEAVAVYLDLGELPQGQAYACKTLLKVNFELTAVEGGALAVHPQTEHVFYSFRYRLSGESSGQHLLDTLLRTVGDATLDISEYAYACDESAVRAAVFTPAAETREGVLPVCDA